MERSCQEVLGQCSGAVWHRGSSRGPDHQASSTLMADLQLQQQDPVLCPVLAASTAKPSNMKERSPRALVQQYLRWFLKNGILPRGQADQCRITLQQLVLPSSLQPDPREVRGYISICERCTVVPCFRKKGRGYDAWYGCSVMPCVCMLMGCLKGP